MIFGDEDEEEDEMTKKILMYTPPRSGFTSITVRDRLLDVFCHSEFWMPLSGRSDQYLEALTESGRKIVKAIAAIDGLERIGVSLYHLNIHFNPLFSWENEIEDQVLTIIENEFGYDRKVDMVEIETESEHDI